MLNLYLNALLYALLMLEDLLISANYLRTSVRTPVIVGYYHFVWSLEDLRACANCRYDTPKPLQMEYNNVIELA